MTEIQRFVNSITISITLLSNLIPLDEYNILIAVKISITPSITCIAHIIVTNTIFGVSKKVKNRLNNKVKGRTSKDINKKNLTEISLNRKKGCHFMSQVYKLTGPY